jgi:hypothetical protein
MAEAAGTCPRLLNYRLAGPGEYPISPRIVPTRAKELGFAAAYAWRGTCAICIALGGHLDDQVLKRHDSRSGEELGPEMAAKASALSQGIWFVVRCRVRTSVLKHFIEPCQN